MTNKKQLLSIVLFLGIFIIFLYFLFNKSFSANKPDFLAQAQETKQASTTTEIFYTEPMLHIPSNYELKQRINYLSKQLSKYAQKLDTCRVSNN